MFNLKANQDLWHLTLLSVDFFFLPLKLYPSFFSLQRAESAQREAESLKERLSLSNQSQQLNSPSKADPDTVSSFIATLNY